MIIKRRIILIGFIFFVLINGVLGIIVSEVGSQSSGITAVCQSGYVVTGGGFLDLGSNGNHDQDASRPFGNGWYCRDDSGSSDDSECYAVCIDGDKIETTIEKVQDNNVQVDCPTDYTLLGGGFFDSNERYVYDDQEQSRPSDDGHGWFCKEDKSPDSAECYALCGKAKTDYSLSCSIEIGTGEQGEGVQVDCPTDSVITGGGFWDASSSGNDQDASKPSGNGWYCLEEGGGQSADSKCYAVCCDISSTADPPEQPDPDPIPDSTATNECSQDDQIIMKLSDDTNAHAELSSQNNYGYEICYDEIFGMVYEGGNPHSCSAGDNNEVVALSASTNAHAEIPGLDNYNSKVCYGDLICEAKTGSCDGDKEEPVVYLSGTTNAHLSASSTTGYDTIICCKRDVQETTGAYWTSMNNEEVVLTSAQVGDTVKLIWDISGYDGETVEFEIFEDDGDFNILGWEIPVDDYVTTVTAQINNGKAIGTWQVIWLGDDGQDEYKFKASLDSEGLVAESGILTVSDDVEDNSAPEAIIVYPAPNESEDDRSFLVSDTILFDQESYDEDDDFKVEWDFGDGQLREILNCQTTGDCDTSYSYSAGGYYEVELIVTDDRGKTDQAEVGVFVYNENGITVFAIIESPADEYEVSDSRTVLFDGTTSFVAQCATSCPSGEICTIIGDQHCYKFVTPPSGYDMIFNWTLNKDNVFFNEYYGSWNNYGSFSKIIPEGNYQLNLKVGYDPAP